MRIESARFGSLEVDPADLLRLPAGLVGMAAYTEFVVLQSEHHDDIHWLQSATEPALALPVVPARTMVAGYHPEISAEDREYLGADASTELEILLVLNRVDGQFTANLRGPIFVNLQAMLARQVVLNDPDYSYRHVVDLRPETV